MQQTFIYDFLGIEKDPVFHKLSTLNKGESFETTDIKVTMNHVGLLEVSTPEAHEAFKDIMVCYRFLSDLLQTRDLPC